MALGAGRDAVADALGSNDGAAFGVGVARIALRLDRGVQTQAEDRDAANRGGDVAACPIMQAPAVPATSDICS